MLLCEERVVAVPCSRRWGEVLEPRLYVARDSPLLTALPVVRVELPTAEERRTELLCWVSVAPVTRVLLGRV